MIRTQIFAWRSLDPGTVKICQERWDNSFQIGVHDTSPHCFHTGVIVPASKLNDCEPFWESRAEVYFRVSANGGSVQTNATNSQIESVAID